MQEALDQVGYRQNGLFVSATRSERLPLEGYDLTVRTPKTVTVLADGRRQRVVTTTRRPSVRRSTRPASPWTATTRSPSWPPPRCVTGMTITVTRVTRKTTTTKTVLKYETVEKHGRGRRGRLPQGAPPRA